MYEVTEAAARRLQRVHEELGMEVLIAARVHHHLSLRVGSGLERQICPLAQSQLDVWLAHLQRSYCAAVAPGRLLIHTCPVVHQCRNFVPLVGWCVWGQVIIADSEYFVTKLG
jgi:hypothetical protein